MGGGGECDAGGRGGEDVPGTRGCTFEAGTAP